MLTGEKLGAAIDAAIKKKGITKKDLADAFGVRPPSVQDWIKRGTISKEKLPLLWSYFSDVVGPEHWGLDKGMPTPSPATLPLIVGGAVINSAQQALKAWDKNLAAAPSPKVQRLYPLISSVQAGNWSEIADNFQPGDAEEWLPGLQDLGPQGFVLRVSGDSMTNPDGGRENFPDGMLVHIMPDADTYPGDFVVAKRTGENSATFKKLVNVEGEPYLFALNPHWPAPYIKLEPGDRIIGKLRAASWRF